MKMKYEIINHKVNRNIANENNITIKKKEFNTNDQLFFETLMMIIRGNTINYSKQKKKTMQMKKTNLSKI